MCLFAVQFGIAANEGQQITKSFLLLVKEPQRIKIIMCEENQSK